MLQKELCRMSCGLCGKTCAERSVERAVWRSSVEISVQKVLCKRAHRSRSSIPSYSPILFTHPVHPSCSSVLFTCPVHLSCPPVPFIRLAHPIHPAHPIQDPSCTSAPSCTSTCVRNGESSSLGPPGMKLF